MIFGTWILRNCSEMILVYLLVPVFILHWISAGFGRRGASGPGGRALGLLPILCASAVLARGILMVAGVFPCAHATGTVVAACGALMLYTVCADLPGPAASGRLSGTFPDQALVVLRRTAMAQVLTFTGVLILLLRSPEVAACRIASAVIAVALSAWHVRFLSYGLMRRPVLASALVSGPQTPSIPAAGKVLDEHVRLEQLFRRVENYMQREKPFLDDGFTLLGLASELATNKSLVSKAINLNSGKNFCQYANKYRVEYAVAMMKRDKRLRVGEVSIMSGFHSVASFNMAFKLFMNDTPSEYMRTLHSSGIRKEGVSQPSRSPATSEAGEP